MPFKNKEDQVKWARQYRRTHKLEIAKQQREYRQAHRPKMIEYLRRYYQGHKLVAKEYNLLHKIKKAEQQFHRFLQLKSEILTHYGDGELACVRCGYTDIRALSIDHINGDGARHRRVENIGSLYPWLKRNQFPSGFQTLCMNCQWVKRVENGETTKGRKEKVSNGAIL